VRNVESVNTFWFDFILFELHWACCSMQRNVIDFSIHDLCMTMALVEKLNMIFKNKVNMQVY